MSSTRPVVRSGRVVQAPALLDLVRTLWRRLRPRSQARMPQLAILSDHLLADVGLNRPSYEQPTWERHIHRH
jgi:uncharacterized protein YjiS (DUF1127 family)